MPAQYIDGKIVANVSAREEQLDGALENISPILGKAPQDLTLDEIKVLVYFILARMNILDEVNASGNPPPPPAKPSWWCWLPMILKRICS